MRRRVRAGTRCKSVMQGMEPGGLGWRTLVECCARQPLCGVRVSMKYCVGYECRNAETPPILVKFGSTFGCLNALLPVLGMTDVRR